MPGPRWHLPYPIEAVETMDRIARAVEPSMGYRHQMPEPGDQTTVGRAMSNAACDLAVLVENISNPAGDIPIGLVQPVVASDGAAFA